MISIEWIRENPILLDYGLSRRNHKPMSEEVLRLDSIYRSILTELQEILARRNQLTTEIANAKKQSKYIIGLVRESRELKITGKEPSKDIISLIRESRELKIKEEALIVQKDESYNEFIEVMGSLPNMPAVLLGKGEH